MPAEASDPKDLTQDDITEQQWEYAKSLGTIRRDITLVPGRFAGHPVAFVSLVQPGQRSNASITPLAILFDDAFVARFRGVLAFRNGHPFVPDGVETDAPEPDALLTTVDGLLAEFNDEHPEFPGKRTLEDFVEAVRALRKAGRIV